MLLSPEFLFEAELEFSLLKCSILWFSALSLAPEAPLPANSRAFLWTLLKTLFCC